MSRAALALLGLFAMVQGFRVPPPARHYNHIVVDHRPPPMMARPQGSKVQLDQGDREYISHEVSDPDVGTLGITALKDPELAACFLYRYMKPLIIPRVQRHFYTRTKTATVLLTSRDKKHFRASVGPAIDKLCNNVRSYWLDENMFYLYMTNKLHPRNAPPPPGPSSDDDEEMSAALIFPTPPPLSKTEHEVKAPPPLNTEHHEMKVPPGLNEPHHDMKVPPSLEKHEVEAPPALPHRIRAPPPLQ